MQASTRLRTAWGVLLLSLATLSACDALVVEPKSRSGKSCRTTPATDTTATSTSTPGTT